jgi:hypothetical protein
MTKRITGAPDLKPGRLAAAILAAGMTGGALAQPEFHVSNEFAVTASDVSGPGDRQSSLSEGARYLNVLGLNGSGKLGGYDYRFTLGAKATDDDRNDPSGLTLTNLQGRIGDGRHTLTLGDAFESFSQYALNTAVKGGSWRYADSANPGGPELTVLHGLAVSRWDNLWDLPVLERRVTAARAKQAFGDEVVLGVSAVRTSDGNVPAGVSRLDGHTTTLDAEYRPIPGLTLRAETSFSGYDEEQATGVVQQSDGNALRLEAVGDADPSRVSLEYERVAPDYVTLAGSATADREKFKAKWRYKHTRDVTWNFGALWFHDNLDGQKAQRTDYTRPEVEVNVRRLGGRQYASGTLSYKLDRSENSTATTRDQFLNANYRDRFGDVDSESNLGVTFYRTTNARDAREVTANTSLGSRHTVGGVVLKPVLYLGAWNNRDELAAPRASDRIVEYSAGLGCDVPAWKLTSNVKLGENRLDKSAGTDSQKTYANLSVHWRPDSLRDWQGTLFARALVNDFRYDPNAVSAQNFRENSLSLGLNVQY